MAPLPVPSLRDADVLRAVAGIRPCRHGGLRLEAETLGLGGREKTVIHNYGHGGCGITLALGTAHGAAELVARALGEGPGSSASRVDEPAAPRGAAVAVLGAGVVGLATALELASRGHAVTVYAERTGVDTTSVLAGAIWLPTGLDFPEDPARRAALNDLLRLADRRLRALDASRWGVQTLPVYEPEGSPFFDHHFESGAIERPTALDRLPVGAAGGAGQVFRTLFVHTPRFLRTLLEELRARGVSFGERRFAGVRDVLDLPEPVAVNCLALGSRAVFGDDAMYPARGVLVHLRPQPLGYIVHDGYKYMFPREDALICGGSFEPGETDPTPPDATVRAILAHHRRFFGCDPATGEPAARAQSAG